MINALTRTNWLASTESLAKTPNFVAFLSRIGFFSLLPRFWILLKEFPEAPEIRQRIERVYN